MHVEVLKYHVALSVGKGIRGLHAIDLSYNNVKRGKTRNAMHVPSRNGHFLATIVMQIMVLRNLLARQ